MADYAIDELQARLEDAFADADRGQVASVRDRLMDVAASAAGRVSAHATVLAHAADQALSARGGLVIECTQADPFQPAYISLDNGVAVYICTHDPAHKIPVA